MNNSKPIFCQNFLCIQAKTPATYEHGLYHSVYSKPISLCTKCIQYYMNIEANYTAKGNSSSPQFYIKKL